MNQTLKQSITEGAILTFIGTIWGYLISLIVFPMFGINITPITIGYITLVFMIIGIVKNIALRRLFNYLHKKGQTRLQSLLEGVIQTTIGTLVSYFLSIIIYPLFGIDESHITIGYITIVFTIASIIKNYLVRRYFNRVIMKKIVTNTN